jgi:hypothetical protein
VHPGGTIQLMLTRMVCEPEVHGGLAANTVKEKVFDAGAGPSPFFATTFQK